MRGKLEVIKKLWLAQRHKDASEKSPTPWSVPVVEDDQQENDDLDEDDDIDELAIDSDVSDTSESSEEKPDDDQDDHNDDDESNLEDEGSDLFYDSMEEYRREVRNVAPQPQRRQVRRATRQRGGGETELHLVLLFTIAKF